MIRRLLILLAVLGSLVGTLSGQIDSRTAYRIRYGAALPAACNPNTGDVFFRTATNIGLHHCTASNTWSFISVVGGVGTFTTINLTAATNQIVLDSDAANTGTVTMAALTGARVWTLQDGTGTLYQTGGTDVTLADGGTNASLTASNGGIFYSTASAGAILAGTATAGQILRSGASAAPAWSTATYPATVGAANTILRSDGTNFVSTTTTLENTTGNIVTLNGAGTLSGARTVSGAWTFSNASFVVSGTGPHAIGRATLSSTALIIGGTFAERVGMALEYNLSPPVDGNSFGFDTTTDLTINEAASGTHPDFATMRLQPPTIVAGGAALTNATTFKITAAPTGATNNRALWVAGGLAEFDGQVRFDSTTIFNTVTYTWPAADGTAGQQLQTDGAGVLSWAAAGSERWMKNIIRQWDDPTTALKAVLATPVYDFTYLKGYGTQDSATVYTGVMADEAPWAMDHFGKQLTGISTFGYTVLSIQALYAKITSLESEVANLKARLN